LAGIPKTIEEVATFPIRGQFFNFRLDIVLMADDMQTLYLSSGSLVCRCGAVLNVVQSSSPGYFVPIAGGMSICTSCWSFMRFGGVKDDKIAMTYPSDEDMQQFVEDGFVDAVELRGLRLVREAFKDKVGNYTHEDIKKLQDILAENNNSGPQSN
jgi:hypothetical protein